MTEKNIKDKLVAFRVDSKSLKELEKMSKKLGAGTANNFVRELAERVINSAGAVDSWKANNDKT
jgi:hypothetical protein